MNKSRRAKLVDIHTRLDGLKRELEEQKDEERGTYDAMSERRQENEAGQRVGANADLLESACDSLEDALTSIDDATAEE